MATGISVSFSKNGLEDIQQKIERLKFSAEAILPPHSDTERLMKISKT